MHEDQLSIDVEQVVALIEQQLPELAGLPVVAVEGAGTVNAVFRVGDEFAARFPLQLDDPERTAERSRAEAAAMAEFRRACPFPAPEPVAIGRPGHGYPMPWAVQTWVPGSVIGPTTHAEGAPLALDLVRLLQHLRACDTSDRRFAGTGRGGVLTDHDDWVSECIERSEALLDTTVMRALWSRFRQLPREDPDGMCHTDLIPSNLLVDGERLVGVLDTGGFQPADPALDLVVAWHVFDDDARELMRTDLGCSALQWERGAAWAFQQAIGAYWYYERTNRAMAEMGRTTLERIVRVFT